MLPDVEKWIREQNFDKSILLLQDVLDYLEQPHNTVRQQLRNIKKEEFAPNERIIFYITQDCDTNLINYIWDACLDIDIPDFFVIFYSNIELLNFKFESLPVDLTYRKIKNPTNFNFPKSLCPEPWINLEIGTSGRMRPCCVYDQSINSIKELSLTDAMNIDALQNLRKEFLQGKKPAGCNLCWKNEELGKTSKRQRSNFFYGNLIDEIDYNNIVATTRTMDIKLGHVCNLKCRICGPNASTSWVNEIDDNKDQLPDLWNYKNKLEWWHSTADNTFIEKMDEISNDLRFLSFAGGEPLFEKNHRKLLEIFVNKGLSNQIELHYNSNGTQYPVKTLEMIDKFKKVAITFSIDNIGKRFEYERHGSSWTHVDATLRRYISERPHYRYSLFQTVNIFNIFDVSSVMQYAEEIGVGYEMHFLEDPIEFCVDNLPMIAKEKIIEKYSNLPDNQFYRAIINKMSHQGTYDPVVFWNSVNRIDKIRKESFAEIYPDMAKFL